MKKVFDKWDLESAVIGEVTNDGLLSFYIAGNLEAQLTGEVTTNYGGATVESRGLVISSRDGTLSVGDANGLRIGFDLSERIDIEPLDLSTLGLGDVTE